MPFLTQTWNEELEFELTEDMSSWKKLQVNVLSGGLSGVLTDCFLYSFDMARTQMAVDMLSGISRLEFYTQA